MRKRDADEGLESVTVTMMMHPTDCRQLDRLIAASNSRDGQISTVAVKFISSTWTVINVPVKKIAVLEEENVG